MTDTPAEPTQEIETDAAPDEIETKVAELEAEVAALKDQHLRALAEVENVRRRGQREVEDTKRYAASSFARDLLSTADNLRRAIESVPADLAKEGILKTLVEGVSATERELLGAFEKHGIKKINPMGEKFDHNFHQAIFETENTGHPAGTVFQVLQPGYVQHDRLLRPAMVGVAKGDTAKPADTASAEGDGKNGQAHQRVDTSA
ncbi:MAG TPA: nucleotide exchange factor GrpE [Stellaceae bacterium]|jgi:molecular chaperone GrpE|nr:nucleotide exchange factor GrpE [Stellaceae bacterium]